jgi:hypothetical protein
VTTTHGKNIAAIVSITPSKQVHRRIVSARLRTRVSYRQMSDAPATGPEPAAEPGEPAAEPRAPAPLPTAIVVPDLPAPTPTAQDETLTRRFVFISLKRAFRLDIHTDEVLATERAHLEATAGHIQSPEHQAFLAWRRSVLLLVALMFVPLSVFRFLESFDGPPMPLVGRIFMLLPALAETAFCVVMFDQLKNWAQWKRQRSALFVAWLLYFAAPFVVYLYPFRTAFDDSMYAEQQAAVIGSVPLGINKNTVHMAIGLAFGVQALLGLGPKVISLMPGLIRASIVTKLQFPGTTAPGWLMMLAAPFYALFAFIIMLLPYQITGSWAFVVGNAGVLAAQVFIGASGRKLTVPLTMQEANARIHKNWLAYIGILVVSAGFVVYGLYTFITMLHLGVVRIITSVLAVVSNVLLDTLVGTDAIIAAMFFFRRRGGGDGPDAPVREQLMRDADTKLDGFCA